jgi:hypothetical protein
MGNNKADLGEIVWGGIDWSDVAQDGDRWRSRFITVTKIRALWNVKQNLNTIHDLWPLNKESVPCI